MFYRVQAFCDLLDSRKEPFGFSIAPFSSAFSECRIDVFREDMEPPVEISLCASRQPALDIIATPFDPAVDLLDLSAKVAKLRTNAAHDLAQFSARFGRPLTYKLSKLAHYMQKPGEKFLRAFIFMLRA